MDEHGARHRVTEPDSPTPDRADQHPGVDPGDRPDDLGTVSLTPDRLRRWLRTGTGPVPR